MKKLIALILISSLVLSAVTFEEAWETAAKYKLGSENIDITPVKPVRSGGNEYWIFEIYSYGNLKTLVPVSSETGEVYTDDSILSAMKVHYLAHFFSTHSEVEDFLDSSKSETINHKSTFERDKQEYNNEFKPSIPDSISLTKESAYLSALDGAIYESDRLIDIVSRLGSQINNLGDVEDIVGIRSNFVDLFDIQLAFAQSLEEVSDTSTVLIGEINEKKDDDPDFQIVASQMKDSLLYSGLIQTKNNLLADIDSNQETINNFFNNIPMKTEQYLLVLQNRAGDIPDEEMQDYLRDKLDDFSSNYTSITVDHGDEINPDYENDIDELNTLITQMADQYNEEDYDAAQETALDIEEKISFLESKIGTWPPDCSGGRIFNGNTCVCPGGQTFIDGKCQQYEEPYEINWMLVGGLLVLIAILILYRFKDKLFDTGDNDEESDDTSMYGYFNQ